MRFIISELLATSVRAIFSAVSYQVRALVIGPVYVTFVGKSNQWAEIDLSLPAAQRRPKLGGIIVRTHYRQP